MSARRAKVPQGAHRHRWRAEAWVSGPDDAVSIQFRCACGEAHKRPATDEEHVAYGIARDAGQNAHDLWHEFLAQFQTDDKWRFRGYEFMQRAAEWVGSYPGDARYVTIDDENFSTAALVLIEHVDRVRGQAFYHGTSVVYIPQTTGENPIVFFLNSEDREGLRAALVAIGKEARVVERAYAEDERRFVSVLRKAKP